MKRIFAFLFLLLFVSPAHTQAQLPANLFDTAAGAPDINNPPIAADNCPEYVGFILNPCIVDESTFVAEVTLTGIPPLEDGQYYYCLKTDPQKCKEDDLKPVSQIKNGGGYNPGIGTVRFPCLTGAGGDKMKESCEDDGSNWFHSGKTYRVSLFDSKKEGAYTGHEAAFYIVHYYPELTQPKAGEVPKLNIKAIKDAGGYNNLVVELKGRNLREKNNDKFNDYFLRVDGYDNDYKSGSTCLFVNESGTGTATIPMPLRYTEDGVTKGEITEGTYILKVFDGKDLSNNNTSCKENSFIYYYVPFTVGRGDTPGVIGNAIKDPKGKELSVNQVKPVPEPICPPEDQNEYGYCTKIPTALGIKINTEPQLFVRDIFTLVLSVGGIAATIFFIQAGYVLMTSAGNKEKVTAAREQITSAIMGLIFIILSITILEFIGVNILRIPGFGN